MNINCVCDTYAKHISASMADFCVSLFESHISTQKFNILEYYGSSRYYLKMGLCYNDLLLSI